MLEREERRARLGIEEVEPSWVDRQLHRAPDSRGRARIEPGIQERAALDDQIRAVVGLTLERFDSDACRFDPEEDVSVRTELLEHDDLRIEGRQRR